MFKDWLKSLLYEPDTGKLSMARLYTNIILVSSLYFWIILQINIPSTMLEVLMLLLSYILGLRGLRHYKDYNEKKLSLNKPEDISNL